MKHDELDQLLEEYLQQMPGDQDTLERLVQAHPNRAEWLRSLIETAVLARALQVSTPPAVQARSRAVFLSQAARKRQPRSKWLPVFLLRPATVLALFIVILVTALFGSGLASAQALPGDTFYPVKISVEQARLSLAANTASRLRLQDLYDQRRVEEVQSLLARGRIQRVAFDGFLERPVEDVWQVSGIPLAFASPATQPNPALIGSYVEIEGATVADQVEIETLRLRLFNLTGKIEDLQAEVWQVDGILVTISPLTRIDGRPALGAYAETTAIRPAGDRLLALSIRLAGSGQPTSVATPSSQPDTSVVRPSLVATQPTARPAATLESEDSSKPRQDGRKETPEGKESSGQAEDSKDTEKNSTEEAESPET